MKNSTSGGKDFVESISSGMPPCNEEDEENISYVEASFLPGP
jgi:hypothetical protein